VTLIVKEKRPFSFKRNQAMTHKCVRTKEIHCLLVGITKSERQLLIKGQVK